MGTANNLELHFIPNVDQQIDEVLTSVGFGFNPGEARRACRPEVLRLNTKSDSELISMGLRRDQIAAHVLGRCFPAVAV